MSAESKKSETIPSVQPPCGVIMPISATDNCTEQHWKDVRAILFEAITEAGYEPGMVSDADDVGIIQRRIIQNVYSNPLVVCDISGRNANVMFELGLRLAFDKATIIVKDDKTPYLFDTSPIEHLPYPRDLRFGQIVQFKRDLVSKIQGTAKAAEDKNYSTFLKHFGEFTVPKLETKEVSKEQYIIQELAEMRELMGKLLRSRVPYRAGRTENDLDNERRFTDHAIGRDECRRIFTSLIAELNLKKTPIRLDEVVDEIMKNPNRPPCFRAEKDSCREMVSGTLSAFIPQMTKRKGPQGTA